MNKSNSKQAGHFFLATLGKKRLRPGGKKASNFLFKIIKENPNVKILEVACNMGTTTVELIKKYNVKSIVSLDLDKDAIEKAKLNAIKQRVDHITNFMVGDALKLPFDDSSFDIVINEAMITMMNDKERYKMIKEYNRVLKTGGFLLTHDVLLKTEDKDLQLEIKKDVTRAIYAHVNPLTENHWLDLYKGLNFEIESYLTGPMTLMSPKGMINDEGLVNTIRIVRNAFKKQNRSDFKKMFNTFKKYKNSLGYIAVISKKKQI